MQNKFDFQLSNANAILTFRLLNSNQIVIQCRTKNNLEKTFQTTLSNDTLPEPLKRKHESVQNFYQFAQFDMMDSDLTYTQGDSSAMIRIKISQNSICQILLTAQKPIEPKKIIVISKNIQNDSEQLKKLLEQQKILDARIQQLEVIVRDKQNVKASNATILEQLMSDKFILDDLKQDIHKFKEPKGKCNNNSIEEDEKYSPQIQKQNGKKRLFMRQQNVTDSMIEQIVMLDLKKIQVLSLGDNKISDRGFNLLFKNLEWPVLVEIYLQNNLIQNIHSIHTIDQIQTLVLIDNNLSEASCNYLCEYEWPFLKNLRLSFKKGLNDKCWKKILSVMEEKFYSLGELFYSRREEINPSTAQSILNYCNKNGISLNHSINKDRLKNIIALQLLEKIMEKNLI